MLQDTNLFSEALRMVAIHLRTYQLIPAAFTGSLTSALPKKLSPLVLPRHLPDMPICWRCCVTPQGAGGGKEPSPG